MSKADKEFLEARLGKLLQTLEHERNNSYPDKEREMRSLQKRIAKIYVWLG